MITLKCYRKLASLPDTKTASESRSAIKEEFSESRTEKKQEPGKDKDKAEPIIVINQENKTAEPPQQKTETIKKEEETKKQENK